MFSSDYICFHLVAISAAPNLSASYLIHVHSPKWDAATQEQCIGELDKATLNILTLADEQKLTSVALPSVGSGQYVSFFELFRKIKSYVY
jgi:O-acetyl-ADP-ribose deacetylase (regulator of RNase III)